MARYHIKVYTKEAHLRQLEPITEDLKGKAWRYTPHCLDNIKYRVIDSQALLVFIKGLKLDYRAIFEYYTDQTDQDIVRVCYRIPYINGIDLILVIDRDKTLITIYINSSDDKHETLKEYLYVRRWLLQYKINYNVI